MHKILLLLFITIVSSNQLLWAQTQIKGTVSGSAGGSYAGVLNIAQPVPEPETYAMFLFGLGIIGFMARCRKNKA